MTTRLLHSWRWRARGAQAAAVVALSCLCQGADAQTATPLKKELAGNAQIQQKTQAQAQVQAPVQPKKLAAEKPLATAATAKAVPRDKPQIGAIRPAPVPRDRVLRDPAQVPATREPPRPATTLPSDIQPAAAAASQPETTAAARDLAHAQWSLPALSAVDAAASAAAATPVKRKPATVPSTAMQRDSALAVLSRHGYAAADTGGLRHGLPDALLKDNTRSQALLFDLRERDRLAGVPQTMRSAMSVHNQRDAEVAMSRIGPAALAALPAGEALADATRRQAASAQCSKASTELDRQELNVRAIGLTDPSLVPGSAPFWDAVQMENRPALEKYQRAARDYTQACLDTQWLSLTEAQRSSMRAVVGHVLLDGAHACMGARIAKDRFLTARHCLYEYDEGLLRWVARRVTQRHIALIGDATTRFEAAELDCRAAQPDTACGALTENPVTADQIVLKIAARSADTAAAPLPPMPALTIERPSLLQFLVVPGHSSWITGRAWGPADEVYVTTAGVPGCMVAEIDSGCVVNACQSEAGFSGAPMFARRNVNELVLVGIFLGTANEYEQCLRADRNFGALPPQHVLAGVR